MKKNTRKKSKFATKANRNTGKGAAGIFVMAAILAMPIAVFVPKNAQAPVSVEKISLSTMDGRENLIEIFTDGFDFEMEKPLAEKDERFKDFKMFAQTYSMGYPTGSGRPTGMGGFKDFNIYALQERNYDFMQDSAKNVFLTDESSDSFNKHINISRDKFKQVVTIGAYDLPDPNKPIKAIDWFGDANYLKRKFPKIDFINGAGARDDSVGGGGISDMHVDKPLFLELNNKKIALGDDAGRVLLQTNITHSPHVGNELGDGTSMASGKTSIKAGHNLLGELFERLKSIKGTNGRSVFDNSMILVGGDHGSHDKLSSLSESDKVYQGPHSNLLLKFPNQTQSRLDIVSDKLFCQPQINQLINDYFTTKPLDPYEVFFNQTNDFDINRTIGINENGGISLGKLQNNELTRLSAPEPFKPGAGQSEKYFQLLMKGKDAFQGA